MLKKIFGDILIDLGNLEGDYRFSQLKSDISRSIMNMAIVGFAVLALSSLDIVLFKDHPRLLMLTIFCRVGYVLVTALCGVILYKTTKVRVFDRLVFGWIFFTIISLVLFNFTRPSGYLSTSFDVIVPFALYLLSPLGMQYTAGLALGFSAGTLYVDYFYKSGVDPMVLSLAASAQFIVHVLGWISAIQMQTYRRKSFKAYIDERDAREMVAYLANIDPLTKSLTRRQFMNIAETEFRRFMRYHRPLSILIIDVDRFKQINDTHGHHAGDLVLRSLSLVSMEQKRAQDTFGRLGGEEFALVMPETAIEQAHVVAERIRHTWEISPVTLDGELIHSTMSIGAAEVISTDRSLEDLLRRADRMLYKAKESGRNRVES